jgi:uncharacterized protein (TIGR02680 family)
MTARFKPTRAGIIGIWDYDEQEFRFANGHLVLRGPNGSGKTKALEVLVPFVLDGSIDARRLDPFSGQERTMRSNLLYGGEKARHGYCWLEFAMGDERVTIGVGLRAQAQRTDLKRWFFVADGSVGESIHLLTPERTPMTHRELRDQLGESHVFTERGHHRAAVDRRLFGLGHERYEAMLNLVLTIRRPQLAKDLDPDSLSRVLSEGLRTVDPELLRTSAVAFDNLEAVQRELSQLEVAAAAVSDLVVHWRSYLRARARRRAEDCLEMRGRVQATRQKIDEAERHIQRAARDADKAKATVDTARSRRDKQQTIIGALQARDAYKNRAQLEDARSNVNTARGARDTARGVLDRADTSLEKARSTAKKKLEARNDVATQLDGHWTTLQAHLRNAGGVVDGPAGLPDAMAWLIARRASVEELRELLSESEKSLACQEQEARGLLDAEAAAEDTSQRYSQAETSLETLLRQIEQELQSWHEACDDAMRDAVPLADLVALVPSFGADADLLGFASRAWGPLREHTIGVRNQARDKAKAHASAILEIDELIEAIQQERDDAPPQPLTRRSPRTHRPGAPLWRLVRFRDDVSEQDRARLEGALLASGVLDAWVDPTDTIGVNQREDTHIDPTGRVEGPTLSGLLEPEEEAPISPSRVRAILDAIGLVESGVFAATDGRFRLGPLAGAYRPERARYIGATARERHRAERIDALHRQRTEQIRDRDAAGANADACDALLTQMDEALEALPSAAEARNARAMVDKADGARRAAEAARGRAAATHAAAQRTATEAGRRLLQGARDHGAPSTRTELEALNSALEASSTALTSHTVAQERLSTAESALDGAQEDLTARETDEAAASTEHKKAHAHHQELAQRLASLSGSLGAEVKQILRQIETASTARDAARQEQEEAEEAHRDAETAKANHIGTKLAFEQQFPHQQHDLERALDKLSPFRRLPVQAILRVDDTEPPFFERLFEAVEAASFTEEQLKTTETRLGNRLATLDEQLGTRFHSVRSYDDGIVLVSIADEVGEHGLARFDCRLADRLETARHLLDDQEQKLFEDHLLGTLCGQLRERIQETTDLVVSMDVAMRSRRLASGKSVGIHWKAHGDADPTRKELLELLGFDARFLTSDRLAKVRQLLSAEVQSTRRERPDRTYLEILEGALDYRRWHHFELTLYDASGTATRLTRRAHSKLSGGEKAAAVHLPLFAAAHAHFSAGEPHSPRLVALDEAFAGIDDTGVPELLRLAAEFDLDWFLTGHDLWVTEPFLPGVMHYDLAHDPVSRAVSAWPILWNGSETIEGEELMS